MRQSKTVPRDAARRTVPAKLTATAFDATAVAVSTALIIGMVGSLVFFLIIAFYRGQYDARLMYIFGLYTAATVLVARIAIDSGRAYANAFSIPLAVVSMLAIMRFVTISGPLGPLSWLVNIGLLAITWVLADRITFDCTLISDRERSLQQGLLQSLGLLKSDNLDSVDSESATEGTRKKTAEAVERTSSKKRRHNPGVWVLYFALLAFPLFGLGQLAIPDDNQRGWAFTFLVSYLACALSLLVLTSLVGMRRYLRQRGVAMPAEMSLQWLSLGIGSVLVILLLCLILPLPGRSLGLIGLPATFHSPDGLGTSRWGWGGEGSDDQSNTEAAGAQPTADASDRPADNAPADGPPQADGQGPPQASPQADDNAPSQNSDRGSAPPPGADSSPDQASSHENSQPNRQENSQPNSQEDSPAKSQANKPQPESQANSMPPPRDTNAAPSAQPADNARQPKATPADANNADANDAEANDAEGRDQSQDSTSSGSSSTHPISQFLSRFSSFSELFKWLTIAVLAAIVIIYAVTHPSEIARLWRELCALLAALFGRRTATAAATATAAVKSKPRPPRRPFSSFANPFASQLAGWKPAQVIEHSFAALEAWAAEHGTPRQEQQTAAEFARQVAATLPAVGQSAVAAAGMLDQLMFADWKPRAEDVKPLVQLWRSFST